MHRDLKPENLFVTKDGRVKILDFGFAKLTQTRKAERGTRNEEAETLLQDAPDIPRSSLRDHPLTIPGTVMGTIAYMSPEQVQGKDLDHRSDIFSFGIILYEMLNGQRAFTGDSQVEVMHAILKADPPDLSETNSRVPMALDRIVRRCLEKKPEHRFQTASDLGFALGTLTTPSGSRVETAAALPALTESLPVGKAGLFGNARLWMTTTAVAVLVALAALPFAVKYLRQSPPAAPVSARFVVAAPEKATEILRAELSPRWPPGGFPRRSWKADAVSGCVHWVRSRRNRCRHGGNFRPSYLVAGQPLDWLPRWRRTPEARSGGRCAQTLCKLPVFNSIFGGTWNRDGVILFHGRAGIYRVPATGGEPSLALGSGQQGPYQQPVFLPDGRHFLVCRTTTQGATEIHLAALDSQETTRLLAADSQARYHKRSSAFCARRSLARRAL